MSETITSTILLKTLRSEGDQDAWRKFCERYEPVLLALAQRAGLRETDARDAVQEALMAFVTALREGRYDRDKGRLRSWLAGIALNKIREAQRRLAKPEIQLVDETNATAFMNRVPDERELTNIFDEEWERAIAAECLREVRREVDEQTFRAFELYAIENWPAEKVAERVGISRNAVYISKTRILSRLRQLKTELAETW